MKVSSQRWNEADDVQRAVVGAIGVRWPGRTARRVLTASVLILALVLTGGGSASAASGEHVSAAASAQPPPLDQNQLGRLKDLVECAPNYFLSLPLVALPGGIRLFAAAIGESCAPFALGLAEDLITILDCSQRYGIGVCTGGLIPDPGRRGAGPAVPDLQPTDVVFAPGALLAGRTVRFDSGVVNDGGQGTGVFNIKWLVDGAEVGAYGSHAGVAAGTRVLDGNSQFEWVFPGPGRYAVTFLVDADDHVAEADEFDNSRTVMVDIAATGPPVIVATSTYQEGALVFVSVSYTDPNGDAVGFGFRGANGSGWAEESHPFGSPSYGRATAGRIDYPFNHGCGTQRTYESDVEFWIYDQAGNRSASVVIHLQCPSAAGAPEAPGTPAPGPPEPSDPPGGGGPPPFYCLGPNPENCNP